MSCFLAKLEPAVEPVEVELAFARLEQDPGEFGDADDVEAGLVHHAEIGLPALFRPMLGVVVDADVHRVAAGEEELVGGRFGRSRGLGEQGVPSAQTRTFASSFDRPPAMQRSCRKRFVQSIVNSKLEIDRAGMLRRVAAARVAARIKALTAALRRRARSRRRRSRRRIARRNLRRYGAAPRRGHRVPAIAFPRDRRTPAGHKNWSAREATENSVPKSTNFAIGVATVKPMACVGTCAGAAGVQINSRI